jgi:hypothetical protein
MELGQLLVSDGLITSEQLKTAREIQGTMRIDQALVKSGAITEDAILTKLSDEFGMKYIDLKDIEVDTELLTKFPTSQSIAIPCCRCIAKTDTWSSRHLIRSTWKDWTNSVRSAVSNCHQC